ncbi:TPA: hypothetical protein ACTW12_003869, partial [Raoultella planticola]
IPFIRARFNFKTAFDVGQSRLAIDYVRQNRPLQNGYSLITLYFNGNSDQPALLKCDALRSGEGLAG